MVVSYKKSKLDPPHIYKRAVLYNAKENIAKVSRRINQPMKSKSFAEFMGSLLNI
jgi:hypothetical protein